MKDRAEFDRFTDALNRIGTDGTDTAAVAELMGAEKPEPKVIRKVMDDMGRTHKKADDAAVTKWFLDKCQQYLDFAALETKREASATRHAAPAADEAREEARAEHTRELSEQQNALRISREALGTVFGAMLTTFRRAKTNTLFHSGIRPVYNFILAKQAISGDGVKITVDIKELKEAIHEACAYHSALEANGAEATLEAKLNHALMVKNPVFERHAAAAAQAGWLMYNGFLTITEEFDDKGHIIDVTVPCNQLVPTYTMKDKVYANPNTNPVPLEMSAVANLFGIKNGTVKKGKGANTTMLKANMKEVTDRFKEIVKGPLTVADRVGMHEVIDATPAETFEGHLSAGFFTKYQPVLVRLLDKMSKAPDTITDEKLTLLNSLADAIDAVINAVAQNGVKPVEVKEAA